MRSAGVQRVLPGYLTRGPPSLVFHGALRKSLEGGGVSLALDAQSYLVYLVDNMAKGTYLGEFEHIVLLSVLRLGDGAHGAMIRTEIEEVTNVGRNRRRTRHARRLERKSLISSWMGEPTAQRGGKAKRQFLIAPAGVEALEQAQSACRLRLFRLFVPWVHPRGIKLFVQDAQA